MALTTKQRLFVQKFCHSESAMFNGTKAAIEAGYSEKSAASIAYENLRKPEIAEAIKIELDSAMSGDEALYRLAKIARGDMGDFLHPESLSVDIQNGDTRLIKKLKYVVYTQDDSQTETVEFELYDAQRALETILKEQGRITKKIDLTSDGERIPIVISKMDLDAL